MSTLLNIIHFLNTFFFQKCSFFFRYAPDDLRLSEPLSVLFKLLKLFYSMKEDDFSFMRINSLRY